MPQKYPKMCPVCNHPKLLNLSDHLNKVHRINGQERKYWLSKAPYSTISSHAVRAHSSVSQSFYTYSLVSLSKTSSPPEQKKLTNPEPSNSTSDENEDELIPCPYDSRISYERILGTNVPVIDYDIFKLQHNFIC